MESIVHLNIFTVFSFTHKRHKLPTKISQNCESMGKGFANILLHLPLSSSSTMSMGLFFLLLRKANINLENKKVGIMLAKKFKVIPKGLKQL